MTFKGLAWVWWAQRRNLQFIEAQQQELYMNVCACLSVYVCVCASESACGYQVTRLTSCLVFWI